jgi:hypothetical protein
MQDVKTRLMKVENPLQRYDMTLSKDELLGAMQQTMLTETIINMFFRIVGDQACKLSGSNFVTTVHTHAAEFAKANGYSHIINGSNARTYLPGGHLTNYSVILCPHHDGQLHWLLVLLFPTLHLCQSFNSLPSHDEKYQQIYMDLILSDMREQNKPTTKAKKMWKAKAINVSQQSDAGEHLKSNHEMPFFLIDPFLYLRAVSCGVFVCMFAIAAVFGWNVEPLLKKLDWCRALIVMTLLQGEIPGVTSNVSMLDDTN